MRKTRTCVRLTGPSRASSSAALLLDCRLDPTCQVFVNVSIGIACGRVITRRYDLNTTTSERNCVERILALDAFSGIHAAEIVNVHTQQTLAIFPSLLNLVLYPWPGTCVCADQYNYTRFPLHVVVDPFLDRYFARALDRFPCVYVFSALSDAKKHWSKMTGGKLYEVAVADTDVLFEGDMSLVDLAFISRQVSEEVEACADRYWQGKCSEKPVIEVLVRNATVLTVVSNNETERQAYFRSWAISST